MGSNMKFVDHSTVTLYKTNAADIDVARAAWASHDTGADAREATEGRVEGLIRFLMREGHTSPFEHGQFTFVVSTPIFVAREFMRHRTFSFNEVSGRYSKLEPEFYVPSASRPLVQTGKVGAYKFEPGSDELAHFMQGEIRVSSVNAYYAYEEMLEAGIAKEVARMVLPVNTMTTFWATVNPLNLMKFLNLRLDGNAQAEIREVAGQMEGFFEETMPMTYEAWVDKTNGVL